MYLGAYLCFPAAVVYPGVGGPHNAGVVVCFPLYHTFPRHIPQHTQAQRRKRQVSGAHGGAEKEAPQYEDTLFTAKGVQIFHLPHLPHPPSGPQGEGKDTDNLLQMREQVFGENLKKQFYSVIIMNEEY